MDTTVRDPRDQPDGGYHPVGQPQRRVDRDSRYRGLQPRSSPAERDLLARSPNFRFKRTPTPFSVRSRRLSGRPLWSSWSITDRPLEPLEYQIRAQRGIRTPDRTARWRNGSARFGGGDAVGGESRSVRTMETPGGLSLLGKVQNSPACSVRPRECSDLRHQPASGSLQPCFLPSRACGVRTFGHERVMGEVDGPIRCPACQAMVPVEQGWRLVRCPRCGEVITRMGEDASFD